MTLTVRSATVTGATTKGSPLTHAELDENFNHLSQSANHSFTQSGSGATSRNVQAKLREIVSPEDLGATGDGADDTTPISNLLARSDDLLHIVNAYEITDVTLANDITCMGDGYIIGEATSGSKPTRATLNGAANAAAALALLETYYPSVITLTANVTIRGNLELRQCLIKSATGHTLKVEGGRLILNNVSFHNVQPQADLGGTIHATGLLSSYSNGVGLYATRAGAIYAPSAVVVRSTGRGCMAQYAGFIDISSGEVYNTGSAGLYTQFGGNIIANAATISTATGNGALTNYGGTIDLQNATVTNCTGGNVAAESNGAIYAEGATITDSGDAGVSTVYGGFINAKSATITGNGTYGAYANGGGYINLDDATVDNTNTGVSSQIVRAVGNGFIYAEEPGVGTGKTTLSSSNYSPGYNTFGNGAAYIGINAQNDTLVYAPALAIGSGSGPTSVTISSDDITITTASSWYNVDTEAAAARDNLDTIVGGAIGQIVVLQSLTATRDVLVRNNQAGAGSSFLLRNACSFLLDNPRDALIVHKDSDGFWNEIARVNVTAQLGGVNTTAVGNVGTGTDDLMTYSLPADSLYEAKKGVRIVAWGTTANNANTKQVTLNFGTTTLLTTALTVSQAGVWRIEAEVFSTGTDAQQYVAKLLQGGTTTLVDVEQGTCTEDDGAAITIKCTGTVTDGGGGVNNNDIVQEGLVVEVIQELG